MLGRRRTTTRVSECASDVRELRRPARRRFSGDTTRPPYIAPRNSVAADAVRQHERHDLARRDARASRKRVESAGTRRRSSRVA